MALSYGSKLIHLFEKGSWSEAIFDVAVGVYIGAIRAFYLLWKCCYVNVLRPISKLVGVQLPEGKRPKISFGELKVAAVGFGRTGTVSFFM